MGLRILEVLQLFSGKNRFPWSEKRHDDKVAVVNQDVSSACVIKEDLHVVFSHATKPVLQSTRINVYIEHPSEGDSHSICTN